VKVGDWYRYSNETDCHQAYQVVAIGRDFVVYRSHEAAPSWYMTKADFDATHELLAEGQ